MQVFAQCASFCNFGSVRAPYSDESLLSLLKPVRTWSKLAGSFTLSPARVTFLVSVAVFVFAMLSIGVFSTAVFSN